VPIEPYDLILKGARLLGRPHLVDVAIRDGRIALIADQIDGTNIRSLDGRLLVPGFVDSHVHLDKAFVLEEPGIDASQMKSFFASLRELKRREAKSSILSRMKRALKLASYHGTTSVRAQIDVDEPAGLRSIEAAIELRGQVSDWIDLQVVAFPQGGLVRDRAVYANVREALKLGADIVGGGAALDSCGLKEHVDAVFTLAIEFDRDIDMHADMTVAAGTPLDSWELHYIAQRIRETGWQNRVAVTHMSAINALSSDDLKRISEMVCDSGISVTTAPSAELHIAKSWQSPPARDVRQVLTNIEGLVAGGVNVNYTTGHVRDGINPFGNADMLLEGLVLTSAYNLGEPVIAGTHMLEMATRNSARAIGRVSDYGTAVGCRADLISLDTSDPSLAIRNLAERSLVIKSGRVIKENAKVN
jgi:cytosine/creatinine deaminase